MYGVVNALPELYVPTRPGLGTPYEALVGFGGGLGGAVSRGGLMRNSAAIETWLKIRIMSKKHI